MDSLIRSAWLLPPEQPIAMPEQNLAQRPRPRGRPRPLAGVAAARAFVFTLTVCVVALATFEMWQVLGLARFTVIGALMIGLFALLLLPIVLSFASCLLGFLVLLHRGERKGAVVPGKARVALLVPIYHEEVTEVFLRLSALRESLCAAGLAARFDLFVLSDSTDPAIVSAEHDAALRLREGAGSAVFYRDRLDGTGKKAGNIADWVRRFGGGYEMFLILDADSEMEAEALRRLADEMEADPTLGLLQTVPVLLPGSTLFGQLNAFASRMYGPVLAAGLACWHGTEGNYWGHNAMIRTRAFAAAAGLPILPGERPFGGAIMSHDFVEAALLRRAGWGVRLLPGVEGSFEGGPPDLIASDKRDRRWCQGNLQHVAVLGTRGLHPMSRLHLLLGIASYVCPALWLLYLGLGIAAAAQAHLHVPSYFPRGHVLFPEWPVVDPERALLVFAGTMALLILPKLLGVLAHLIRSARASTKVGVIALLRALCIELVTSTLLAPVTMLRQAHHLFDALMGRDSGWSAQRRAGQALQWRDALAFTRGSVALGLLFLGITFAVNPSLTVWMLPVLVGLLLAPLVVWWTGRAGPFLNLVRAKSCNDAAHAGLTPQTSPSGRAARHDPHQATA